MFEYYLFLAHTADFKVHVTVDYRYDVGHVDYRYDVGQMISKTYFSRLIKLYAH